MGSTYTPENMVLSSVVGPTLTKYLLSLIEIYFVLFISFPPTFNCEIHYSTKFLKSKHKIMKIFKQKP